MRRSCKSAEDMVIRVIPIIGDLEKRFGGIGDQRLNQDHNAL